MAGLFINQSATMVEVLDPEKVKVMVYTKDAAGNVLSRHWEDVLTIKAMVGGAWTEVWPKPFANIENYLVNGGGLLAGYRINANGQAEWSSWTFVAGQTYPDPRYYGVIETWLKKGSANQFVVKAVKDPNPGYAVPAGSPTDQWIDCSASPEWWTETNTISLITVTLGRVDANGVGAGITDELGVDLQTESGVALTDTTITVTEMDSAQITLNALIN